jgi:uncharacterized protein YkwD
MEFSRQTRLAHLPTAARPSLALSLTLLTLGASALAQPISPDSITVAEQYLLAAANQERAALGLSQLHRDPRLAQAAAAHARQMAAHATISHQFSGESELTARGAAAGVPFSAISENVGEAPSAPQIHDLWMHSPHHRSNLLDPSIDVAGISVIARGNELFAVEDFARTVRSVSLEQQESAIAALVTQLSVQPAGPAANQPSPAAHHPVTLDLSPTTTSAARQTCAMDTGFAGPRKPWFVMRFTSDSLTQLPTELRSRIASGRYRQAAVGACPPPRDTPFTSYNLAVLLYP